ncbi:hypothetical protein ACFLQ8_01735 [Candidatus Auribacterota bacterium]
MFANLYRRRFVKIVSLSVVLIFTITSTTYGIPRGSLDFKREISERSRQKEKTLTYYIDPAKLVISENFGAVTERFKSSGTRNSGKLIIQIQDSHCNYEAQTNIRKIIESLTRDRDISNALRMIAVEGARGIEDPAYLRSFPEAKIRAQASDYFVKIGWLTGPEFYAINYKEKPLPLFGAENKTLYGENLEYFRKSKSGLAEDNAFLTRFDGVVEVLERKIFSKALAELVGMREGWDENKVKFTDYCEYIYKLGVEYGVILSETKDLSNKKDPPKYPNFYAVIKTLQIEKKIDPDRIDPEREALVAKLQKAVVKEELSELVKQSLYLRIGKITSDMFYGYIKREARSKKIDMSKYPNLSGYIDIVTLNSEIDAGKIFSEVNSIEIALKKKMFRNRDEEDLDELVRQTKIMKDLLNLRMTRENLTYYQDHKKEMSPDRVIKRLSAIARRAGMREDVSGSLAWLEKNKKIDTAVCEDFYKAALERDKVLVENTLKEMEAKKANAAAVVAGGFHTEGMKQLFKAKGYSYVVITPMMTKGYDDKIYLARMLNKRTAFDKIFENTGNRLAPWSMLNSDRFKQDVVPVLASYVAYGEDGRPDFSRVEKLLRLWLRTNPAAKEYVDRVEFAEAAGKKDIIACTVRCEDGSTVRRELDVVKDNKGIIEDFRYSGETVIAGTPAERGLILAKDKDGDKDKKKKKKPKKKKPKPAKPSEDEMSEEEIDEKIEDMIRGPGLDEEEEDWFLKEGRERSAGALIRAHKKRILNDDHMIRLARKAQNINPVLAEGLIGYLDEQGAVVARPEALQTYMRLTKNPRLIVGDVNLGGEFLNKNNEEATYYGTRVLFIDHHNPDPKMRRETATTLMIEYLKNSSPGEIEELKKAPFLTAPNLDPDAMLSYYVLRHWGEPQVMDNLKLLEYVTKHSDFTFLELPGWKDYMKKVDVMTKVLYGLEDVLIYPKKHSYKPVKLDQIDAYLNSILKNINEFKNVSVITDDEGIVRFSLKRTKLDTNDLEEFFQINEEYLMNSEDYLESILGTDKLKINKTTGVVTLDLIDSPFNIYNPTIIQFLQKKTGYENAQLLITMRRGPPEGHGPTYVHTLFPRTNTEEMPDLARLYEIYCKIEDGWTSQWRGGGSHRDLGSRMSLSEVAGIADRFIASSAEAPVKAAKKTKIVLRPELAKPPVALGRITSPPAKKIPKTGLGYAREAEEYEQRNRQEINDIYKEAKNFSPDKMLTIGRPETDSKGNIVGYTFMVEGKKFVIRAPYKTETLELRCLARPAEVREDHVEIIASKAFFDAVNSDNNKRRKLAEEAIKELPLHEYTENVLLKSAPGKLRHALASRIESRVYKKTMSKLNEFIIDEVMSRDQLAAIEYKHPNDPKNKMFYAAVAKLITKAREAYKEGDFKEAVGLYQIALISLQEVPESKKITSDIGELLENIRSRAGALYNHSKIASILSDGLRPNDVSSINITEILEDIRNDLDIENMLIEIASGVEDPEIRHLGAGALKTVYLVSYKREGETIQEVFAFPRAKALEEVDIEGQKRTLFEIEKDNVDKVKQKIDKNSAFWRYFREYKPERRFIKVPMLEGISISESDHDDAEKNRLLFSAFWTMVRDTNGAVLIRDLHPDNVMLLTQEDGSIISLPYDLSFVQFMPGQASLSGDALFKILRNIWRWPSGQQLLLDFANTSLDKGFKPIVEDLDTGGCRVNSTAMDAFLGSLKDVFGPEAVTELAEIFEDRSEDFVEGTPLYLINKSLLAKMEEWKGEKPAEKYKPETYVAVKEMPVVSAFKAPGEEKEDKTGETAETVDLSDIREVKDEVEGKIGDVTIGVDRAVVRVDGVDVEIVEGVTDKIDFANGVVEGGKLVRVVVSPKLLQNILLSTDEKKAKAALRILARHEYVENVLGRSHAFVSVLDSLIEETTMHALMEFVIPLMSNEQLLAIGYRHLNDTKYGHKFYYAARDELLKGARGYAEDENYVEVFNIYNGILRGLQEIPGMRREVSPVLLSLINVIERRAGPKDMKPFCEILVHYLTSQNLSAKYLRNTIATLDIEFSDTFIDLGIHFEEFPDVHSIIMEVGLDRELKREIRDKEAAVSLITASPSKLYDEKRRLSLIKMLRLLLRSRYYPDLRWDSLGELCDFAEVRSFFSFMQWEKGEDLSVLPEKKIIQYFNEYLSELEDVENQSILQFDRRKLDHMELFKKVREIENARRSVERRWDVFNHEYIEGLPWESRFIAGEMPDARSIARHPDRYFKDNPDLRVIYEKSLTSRYKALADAESKLKGELRKQVKINPVLIREILQALYEQELVIDCDTAIDWLLKHQVVKTERTIAEDISLVRDEQYMYGGTPYGKVQGMLKALGLKHDDVLYDLGSGYGRVILYAGMVTDVGHAVGLELVNQRVNRCNEIKDELKLNNIEFRQANCRDEDVRFDNGTVFFLFNPFSSDTLNIVGEKLKDIASGKKIRIVSLGSSNGYFERCNWLRKVEAIGPGDPIVIFESENVDVLRALEEPDKRDRADRFIRVIAGLEEGEEPINIPAIYNALRAVQESNPYVLPLMKSFEAYRGADDRMGMLENIAQAARYALLGPKLKGLKVEKGSTADNVRNLFLKAIESGDIDLVNSLIWTAYASIPMEGGFRKEIADLADHMLLTGPDVLAGELSVAYDDLFTLDEMMAIPGNFGPQWNGLSVVQKNNLNTTAVGIVESAFVDPAAEKPEMFFSYTDPGTDDVEFEMKLKEYIKAAEQARKLKLDRKIVVGIQEDDPKNAKKMEIIKRLRAEDKLVITKGKGRRNATRAAKAELKSAREKYKLVGVDISAAYLYDFSDLLRVVWGDLLVFLLSKDGKVNLIDLEKLKGEDKGIEEVVNAAMEDRLLPLVDVGAKTRTNAAINAYKTLGFQA